MKAVGYRQSGSIDRPDALIDIDLPAPVPGPRDLLVRIKAVSVNPVDTKIRSTAQPAHGEFKVLGYDAAGVVEAVGEDVTLFNVGDEVFYSGTNTRQGSNAELQVVDERLVGIKPAKLSWAEAAAMPLTSVTAWELLFDRLGVEKGAKGELLVINGAGGVGSVLIQLARHLTEMTVIATASRPETIEWVKRMGAHQVINHRLPLSEELARISIPEVSHVASLSGSQDNQAEFAKIIAPQGHLALIDSPASFDIAPFKPKSITVAWEYMFTRSMFQTPDMDRQHQILNRVSAMLDLGQLTSTATEEGGPINAANLIAMHRKAEAGTAIGKMVLTGF
ncbi:zinc-binding alcohol dehydrogenase family protein [uncultured Brevundimonas sp.]|uniref:zinc-binding alcohol dehydrogenase family protein n=1 Tax=uncultured Brevundimonas sp. TaxID=213418 RepID=UPI002610505C|nr:zinc-binding alcohol dehydrogenase family protein [uncultured Brevundimonas sp.]